MLIDKFIDKIAKESFTVISKNSAYRQKLVDRLELLLNDSLLKDIIQTKLTDLNNWTGTYAEILIISLLKRLKLPLVLEKTLSQNQTLLGSNRYVKPDIYIKQPYNLFIEVKQFTGVNKELTDSIIKVVEKKTGVWKILANYQYDSLFNKGSAVVSDEIKDLTDSIKKGNNHHYSKNFRHLNYSIYREKTLMTLSLHSYNSYRFAEQFKYYTLNHADQILKKKSNILAFVLSPKYKNPFLNGFDLDIGLRAFARRTFIELTKDNRLLNEISDKWTNQNVRISSVAKRITAILFYIDGIDKPDTIYFYENPNANELCKEKTGIEQLRMGFDYNLKEMDYYYDNFEFDNY